MFVTKYAIKFAMINMGQWVLQIYIFSEKNHQKGQLINNYQSTKSKIHAFIHLKPQRLSLQINYNLKEDKFPYLISLLKHTLQCRLSSKSTWLSSALWHPVDTSGLEKHTVKVEAVRSSDMLIPTYKFTGHYKLDHHEHIHCH